MMHPFDASLNEFAFAIRHFVPTLPAAIKQQAVDALDKLKADPTVSEAQIKQVFFEIGVQEYPHRCAYQELTQGEASTQLQQMVLEHVDQTVRTIIEPHLQSGVTLEEFIRSELFETVLTAEQRYQVEDGLLVGSRKLAAQLAQKVSGEEGVYESLVKKWTVHAQEIQRAIEELASLATHTSREQAEEIQSTVARFREGFLVTEPDPELDEVKKEVEYWKEALA